MVRFSLPNKLKVLVLENKKAPVVTLQAWVRTGSADEVKGQEGLSHFIEHLLFKGTRKFQVGEIAKTIEASGGELNAYTSFDQTVFYMTLSSEYVETALEALSEMMGHPLFDQKEVDSEREVVIEEIKRSNDSPARISSQALFSSMYPKHPYGRPVIGYDEVVKKTPVPKIKNLFKSRYCPENMFLIVAGDVDAKTIRPKVAQYFSGLGGRLKKVKRIPDIPLKGPILRVEKSQFKESFMNLAFKTLKATEREEVVFELLSSLLSQGESSRLIQSLRLQNQVVNDFGASYFSSKAPGFFTFTSYLEPEKALLALDTLATEILLLAVEPPSQEEINRSIQHIESQDDYQETIGAEARKVGHYEFLYNNPDYHQKFLKILKSVRPEEVSQVVRKFFSIENMAVTLLTPKSIDLKNWAQEYGQAFQDVSSLLILKQPSASSQSEGRFKQPRPHSDLYVLEKGGAKIVFYPIKNTKVVNCRLGFLGGLRADPDNKWGAGEMLAKTWASGTTSRSEAQISNEIEALSSSLVPFSGRNSLGVSLTTLSYYQNKIQNVFQDVLLRPAFPTFSFDREKNVLQSNLQSLEDHPSQLVFLDFMRQMFTGHPYQRETFGTLESLKNISPKDLSSLHSRLVSRKNLTGVVAGNYDASFWEESLEQIFEALPEGEKFAPSFDLDPISQDKRAFRALEKEQSHIVFGYRGISLSDEKRFALSVMQAVLSGQGGRLFLNLRDKASLAYTVAPIRMEGIDTGYFGAYIGCSPEKGSRALQMMSEEFTELATHLISQEELDRAKKYLIGKHDISLQKTSSIGNHILFDVLYGLPIPNPSAYKENIYAVTAEDIRDLAQKIFRQKFVQSCVGPVCPW